MKNAIQKLSTSFEILCAVSMAALTADLGWLAHDIFTNGFSVVYASVALGLFVGDLGTLYVWVRHFKGKDKDVVVHHHHHHYNGPKARQDDSYRHLDD